MATPMKTTIEIQDSLFKQARRYADAHDMTMKALIEEGLRKVIAEKKKQPVFELRDGSVDGNGLTAEFRDAGWERIRDAVYEGHG